MAKLYFRHGPVNSAKTLNLLAVAHNYRKQGKRVLLIKPEMDDRSGTISSRCGMSEIADIVVPSNAEVWATPRRFHYLGFNCDCVLVDEAQFLLPGVIDQLRAFTIDADDDNTWHRKGVPVICYGLRTDFRRNLFPGSRRLLELADSIEEVKVTCNFCNRKAIYNLRIEEGKPTLEGESVALGWDRYTPTCHSCYMQKTNANDSRNG